MVETEHDVALEDTDRLHGRSALVNNVKAATALAGAVRSTLGPRGLDKMLVEDGGPATVTNDGVTVLEAAKVEHPTARLLISTSSAQDRAARDGTTTTVILTSELLQNALELVRSGVHPSIIMNGYQIALAESLDEMGRISRTPRDDSELRAVVATSISGKVDSAVGRHLTEIAIEAAEELDGEDGGHDLERMRVKRLLIKDGGTLDSEVVRGLVLPKSRMDVASPADSDGGRIAIIDGGMESPELELDASIEVTSTEALRSFHERSRERMREQVDLLASLEI
ncbi:MAG: TCP-1/cpn60 chaperonin family protein, partial [Candidatus Thermoplasmatota archaeon]|nr:TCP-1/cpn60 chaperonin family protein [Candidatus Thermoplasmatota archaeon]